MTWVEPQTQITTHVVTATEYNQQIIGNIGHLMYSRPLAKVRYSGANYTNSGGTTWAVIDSTNLRLSIPSSFNSQRLFVTAEFDASVIWTDGAATPPYYVFFDLKLDTGVYISSGTSTPRPGGMRTMGRGTGANTGLSGTGAAMISMCGYIEGIAKGAHTVDLAWAVDHATSIATLYTGLASPATPYPDVVMMAWEY